MSISIWDYEKPLDAMMLSHDHIAMLVMKHEQQIKDLAAHLREIKQDSARMERRYIWAVNALMEKDYGEPDVTQSSPLPPA
jgi:hypothetical protein